MKRENLANGRRSKMTNNKRKVKKEEHKCTLCSKVYSNRANLHRHRRIHHSLEIPHYKCSYCNRIYIDKERKLRHEKEAHLSKHDMAKSLKCSHCPSTFKVEFHRNMHVQRMHSGQNTHVCKLCPSSFNKKASLKWHKSVHHNFKIESFDRNVVLAKKRKTPPYGTKRRRAPNKKGKQNESNVPVTMRTKKGVQVVYANELSCSYCPAFFTTLFAKELHEKRHIGDRAFTCKICSAAFYRPQSVRSHKVECRTLPLMSWCQFCDYHTLERTYLEKHYIRNHGLKFQTAEELEFYRREILKCEPNAGSGPGPESDEPASKYDRTETSNDEMLSTFDDDPSSSESNDESEEPFQNPIVESSCEYFEDPGPVIEKEMQILLPRSVDHHVDEMLHEREYMMQIDRLEEMFRDDEPNPLEDSFRSAIPDKAARAEVPVKIERPICENEVLESNEDLRMVLQDQEGAIEQQRDPHHVVNIKTEIKYSQVLAESVAQKEPIDEQMVKYEVEVAQLNTNLRGIIFQSDDMNENDAVISGCEIEQNSSRGVIDLTCDEIGSPIIVIDDDD